MSQTCLSGPATLRCVNRGLYAVSELELLEDPLPDALGEVDRRDYALALLDVDVPDGKTFAVARRLMDRAVPFAFVSAIRRVDMPLEFADAPIVGKPYRPNEVRSALRTAS